VSELLFLVLAFGIYALPICLIVFVVSALRKTPARNGFIAFGWSVLMFIGAAVAGGLVPSNASGAVMWLAGAGIGYLVSRRDGYKLDWQGWVLLFLSIPGYWLLMWRRENQIWKARPSQPTPAIVGESPAGNPHSP
jgi:4-amino-4-deoxy-L-arabinose transferase-like glycosyltransferase